MKKLLILISLMMLMAANTSAQLKVTSDGRVRIASSQTTSGSTLIVGNRQYESNTTIAGITGSTTAKESKNNVGVIGVIDANSNISNDKNYGVLGIVQEMNYAHGRNYGLCGMIGFPGNHYGGAGVYGTNCTYYYDYPDNIQGLYAGFFHGGVKVIGDLVASNVFIPTDSRLNRNVVSLNEVRGETSTLDNLLSMNVIEYNMKSRANKKLPSSIEQQETEANREVLEYLMKDERKMCSRRHYGVDAKELQKIYPDLVLEGQDGYLSVNYVELVPILIRSIQELKAELDEVKGNSSRMDAETRGASLESETTPNVLSSTVHSNILYQNTPNPFKERTSIRFKLADNAQNAAICIFDMTGKMLKKLPVSSDMESVSIGGYELGEGMFLYSLIVNGQVIDTKRMVISK